MKKTTFEIIIAKGESVHEEQFLLWPQWFQLYSIIFCRDLLYFCIDVFKVVCCRCVICGKDITVTLLSLQELHGSQEIHVKICITLSTMLTLNGTPSIQFVRTIQEKRYFHCYYLQHQFNLFIPMVTIYRINSNYLQY